MAQKAMRAGRKFGMIDIVNLERECSKMFQACGMTLCMGKSMLFVDLKSCCKMELTPLLDQSVSYTWA